MSAPTSTVAPSRGRYAYRVFRLVVTILIFAFAILGILSLLPEEESIMLAKPPPLEATILTLQSEVLPEVVERHARLVPVQEWDIALDVGGRVAERPVQNGSRLRADAAIVALDLTRFEAQLASAEARITEVQASLTQAEAQLQRVQKLRQRGDESQKALDDALSARDRARAGLADAEAQRVAARYDVAHARFLAPARGVVSHLDVEVGERVAAGQLLGKYSRTDTLLVRVLVGWEVRRGIEDGAVATIIDGRNRHFTATLARGARIQSGETGQFELEFEVPNPAGALVAGEPVRCRFEHGGEVARLRVPRPSLYEEYGAWRALVPGEVVDGACVVRSRPVTLGNINATEGWVEIYSGLAAGDRLVVPKRGATLRDGLRVIEGAVPDVWLPPYASQDAAQDPSLRESSPPAQTKE